jgi:predicted metal-dependent hydrolase
MLIIFYRKGIRAVLRQSYFRPLKQSRTNGTQAMMQYTVTKSARKTAAIYIRKNGEVEVRCPTNFPDSKVDRFVKDNLPFIEHRVECELANKQSRDAFSISPGDKLLFLGKEYPLETVQVSKVGFDGKRFYMPNGLPVEDIKPAIIKIYKKLAANVLKAKTEKYAQTMHITPTGVKINSAKTRWGSCSGKNSINYAWRLIMVDEHCVDYVVIHELAHIAQHNHSSKFWALVEQHCPDYKEQKQTLHDLQQKLSAENWD